MFKSFPKEELSKQNQAKSSVARAIRADILELYPRLEHVIEDLLPKKSPPVIIAKSKNGTTVAAVDGRPLFFQPKDDHWYPTLRVLHEYPSMMPKMRVDRGAIPFVLKGANIMCPGLTSPGGAMEEVEEGVPVQIVAEGKEHACAVGRTKMDTKTIRSSNQGFAIDNLHFLGDDLFSKHKTLSMPEDKEKEAQIDVKTGKLINPHNPNFITQAPWYLNQQGASLEHQKAWNLKESAANKCYKRGTKGDVKTKFQKGACENCGASTHQKKDCFERPRKLGAKFTGRGLASDDLVGQDLTFDYEGKRDMYKGYDPEEFTHVIKEFHEVEEARAKEEARKAGEERRKKLEMRKLKEAKKKLKLEAEEGEASNSDSEDSDDDADSAKIKDFEGEGVTDSKDDALRTSARNLRIREDTAKYLLNLDPDSAFYDPKTRSMRDDPLKDFRDEAGGKASESLFKGDNFTRDSGLAKDLQNMNLFAWDSFKAGGEGVHVQAAPTRTSMMIKIHEERKKELEEKRKRELRERYGGGEEDADIGKEEVMGAETENYYEFDASGKVIPKNVERRANVSVYEEDVLEGEHSEVWGSYFDPQSMKWGFKCCGGTERRVSFCRGGGVKLELKEEAEVKEEEGKSPKKRKVESAL